MITVTTHAKHAIDIAQTLLLNRFDALVCLSGDGLAHEVLNGFALHAEPMRALQIPIAFIPTGSANGTALNLLGYEVKFHPYISEVPGLIAIEGGRDIAVAALNVIKGQSNRDWVYSDTHGIRMRQANP